VAVGNPTIDLDDDGRRAVGGTVVYSALQAARLGLPALVVGRAAPADLATIGAACADEVRLALRPARATTVFHNSRLTEPRRQYLRERGGVLDVRTDLARAAAIVAGQDPDAPGPAGPGGRGGPVGPVGPVGVRRQRGILHIAPVARETPATEIVERWEADLVGLTPQGLIRHWDATGAVHLTPLDDSPRLGHAVDVLVTARAELPYLAGLVDVALNAGRIVVVTAGARGCEVWRRGGVDTFPAFPCPSLVDDTGAGDVFTAALLVELYHGRPLASAVAFAAVAAALSLRGIGPSRLADRAEIAALADRWAREDDRRGRSLGAG